MKTLGYVSPFVPPEWIAAHGWVPRRISPRLDVAAEASPAGMCPFARAVLHEVRTNPAVDAVVFATTCDQMRRTAEWAGIESRPEIFLLNVPSCSGDSACRALYREELIRLGRFLVEHGGRAPSTDHVRQLLLRHDDLRRTPNVADGRPLTTRDSGLSTQRLHSLASAVAALWPDKCASGSERAREDRGGDAAPTGSQPMRFALIGGPLCVEAREIFGLVRAHGGEIVLEGTEGGVRTLPAPCRWPVADPIDEIVRIHFDSIPDVFRRPDTLLTEWVRREVARVRADMIILYRYVWCDLWHAQVQRLRDITAVPVLDLEVGDTWTAARVRLLQRLQTAMEMST